MIKKGRARDRAPARHPAVVIHGKICKEAFYEAGHFCVQPPGV